MMVNGNDSFFICPICSPGVRILSINLAQRELSVSSIPHAYSARHVLSGIITGNGEKLMLGPAVNAIAIVICSLAGCFLVRGIPSRFEDTLKKATGLAVVYVGIKGALENERVLLLIMSLVAGAFIGELIDIDAAMSRLGLWAERKLNMKEKAAGKSGTGRSFSKGFVTASILYCSGSMAIVGSMQSGLTGNHDILFTKTILDGSISIVFAASMGIGVAFSAFPVFIYQSGIALASMALRNFLSQDIIREMSSVGSLLVAAIGFNFLGVKEIKVANLIPAIFIPLAYMILEGLLAGS
jgi:uncharacterized membrane protein YqgA involved in biofilm formation